MRPISGRWIAWNGRQLVLTAEHVIAGTTPETLRFFLPTKDIPQNVFARDTLVNLKAARPSHLADVSELAIAGVKADAEIDLAAIDIAGSLTGHEIARFFTRAPGGTTPHEFVVIRENTEGPYVGEGGVLRKGTLNEVATQGSVNTRMGVERCIRYAFELATTRERKHVTLVHKTNVLTFAGDLWQRTFDIVAAEFPDVATAYNHVDAACIYFVQDPHRYDVIDPLVVDPAPVGVADLLVARAVAFDGSLVDVWVVLTVHGWHLRTSSASR